MTNAVRVLPRIALAAAIVIIPALATAQSSSAAGSTVTFTKDVAPILQRSCVTCHRPGESAPMSLMTYEDARPWARSIKARTTAREMPPWHIDRNIGITKFKDDPSLSDEEIAVIAKWVDSNAPRGNPADMPPPRQFPSSTAWQLGTPDLVVHFPTFKMPATGPDLFGSLYAAIDLKEDRYIKAIQTRPVNEPSRRVVHHALTFTVPANAAESQDGGDDSNSSGGGQFLVEYASGKNAEFYPADSGLLVQSGLKMKVNYHLHSIGEPVDTGIEVGILFHPAGYVPKNIRWSKQLGHSPSDLDIPGGEIVRVDGYTRFNRPARITAFQPHMHARGSYQCFELIYPTSGANVATETVNCAHFNYNWHLVYNYADDVAPIVPPGTLLHVISWYDNTSGNKNNPDPKNWVGNGNRTIDEMSFSWIGWVDLTPEDYKAEFEARKNKQKAATTSTTAQQQP